VETNEVFANASEAGNATRFEDQYIRMAMSFDTGAANYAWLTQHLFVAEGRLTGKNEIEYRIYRVT
jgi:Protein of unknown function (DUF3237)